MSTTRERARIAFMDLIREKIRPTPPKLRERIGGGGTDLLRSVIQEMENELYDKMFSLSSREDVPPELVDKILDIWNACNDRADARYQTQRDDFERRLQVAEAGRLDAERQVTRLSERNQSLQAELLAKTGTIGALQEGVQAAEARCEDLEQVVRDLRDEVGRVRDDAGKRIAAADQAEERSRSLASRLEAETGELRKHLQDGELTIRQLTADLAEARGRLAAVEDERDGLRRQVAARGRKISKAWKGRASPAGKSQP